ncbi:MAG: ParB/Srx family N-terminal domain-containing protein [Magnetococcales bacterium]|nr:ParB/Srx family N-terminal domain-containing protein [Magnetococcales bacterium]
MRDLPFLKADAVVGSVGQLLVKDLKPTQMAVGMDETAEKEKKYAKMDDQELDNYLLTHMVPVVIGNGGNFYLIDHHHLSFALWGAAGKSEKERKFTRDQEKVAVVAQVVSNWKPITGYAFWKSMNDAHWLYPFDHLGGGPLKPGQLPKHIKELKNDPYRSLAWYVRNRYGYTKSAGNAIFAEFKWAEFFRNLVMLDNKILDDSDKDATTENVMISKLKEDKQQELIDFAIYLAKSPAAAGLPGYLGNG